MAQLKNQSKKIAIFGAGITGLSAARELIRLGHEVHVYETLPYVGGLAATFKDDDGFTYDNGPRFIFSTLAEKLGILEDCVPVKYFEHLHVEGRDYLFPFGFAYNPRFALSVGLAFLTRYFLPKPVDLGAFLKTYYGPYFSSKTLAPLIEKWSGVASNEMSIDFASRLLPTNLSYIVHCLVKKIRGGITEDYYKKGRYIVYPKTSNAKIFEALCETKGLQISLSSGIRSIETNNRHVTSVTLESGNSVTADYYLSTMPINNLAKQISPHGILDHWLKLQYRSIVILFIKLNKPKILDGLWTWFPETKFPFYRIAEYKNAVPGLAPNDKTLISVEHACQEGDNIWTMNQEELFSYIFDDLHQLYGIKTRDVLGLDINRCAHAYPVLRKETEDLQRSLKHTTPIDNLFLAGRTGMFQYRMTEGSYDSAMDCASAIEHYINDQPLETNSELFRDAYGRPLVIHE
ncbi:MAG: FAD-dependent oxidoreductase [Bdellovibrionales bacterium]|nr:FAD-dependent oxidoreductase [Bdellovibrionales bacterium]